AADSKPDRPDCEGINTVRATGNASRQLQTVKALCLFLHQEAQQACQLTPRPFLRIDPQRFWLLAPPVDGHRRIANTLFVARMRDALRVMQAVLPKQAEAR